MAGNDEALVPPIGHVSSDQRRLFRGLYGEGLKASCYVFSCGGDARGVRIRRMPRYFFDIFDGRQLLDDVGVELPSVKSARIELVKSTGEYLRDHPTRVWQGETWFVRLRDEDGLETDRLDLKAVKLPT